jgi:hypothetical protein
MLTRPPAVLTIYFFYPETQGRTLEELAFREFPEYSILQQRL